MNVGVVCILIKALSKILHYLQYLLITHVKALDENANHMCFMYAFPRKMKPSGVALAAKVNICTVIFIKSLSRISRWAGSQEKKLVAIQGHCSKTVLSISVCAAYLKLWKISPKRWLIQVQQLFIIYKGGKTLSGCLNHFLNVRGFFFLTGESHCLYC